MTYQKAIEEIKKEYRATCRKEDRAKYEERLAIIRENIEYYISLHNEVTDDLMEHCDIMIKEMWAMYNSEK